MSKGSEACVVKKLDAWPLSATLGPGTGCGVAAGEGSPVPHRGLLHLPWKLKVEWGRQRSLAGGGECGQRIQARVGRPFLILLTDPRPHLGAPVHWLPSCSLRPWLPGPVWSPPSRLPHLPPHTVTSGTVAISRSPGTQGGHSTGGRLPAGGKGAWPGRCLSRSFICKQLLSPHLQGPASSFACLTPGSPEH